MSQAGVRRHVLVLASASPRRTDLLGRTGLKFRVRTPEVDEVPPPGAAPRDSVLAVARRKADAVRKVVEELDFVLAADTSIVLAGRLIGKPRDAEDAKRILATLSGQTHEVLTAVVVDAPQGRRFEDVVSTEVTFAELTPEVIEAYVATGEPLGKAGAYAIQGEGRSLVAGLKGDYTNVVGLPVRRTIELLQQAGYPLPGNLAIPQRRPPLQPG